MSEAVRLAQRGERSAFGLIYELCGSRVYALCLRMVGDASEAEDLTQEVFLQLLGKIHTFRGESAFSSWLYRLTANLVLMHFRKKKPITMSFGDVIVTDEEMQMPRYDFGVPDLRLKGLFDRINLEKAIGRLPESHRSIFVLYDVEGLNHSEIAKIFGCSVATSKLRLHKARKRLRKTLCGLQLFGPTLSTESFRSQFS